MNWSPVVAPFVSMTLANIKKRERNKSEVVEDEFYNQSQDVKFSKIHFTLEVFCLQCCPLPSLLVPTPFTKGSRPDPLLSQKPLPP